VGYSQPRFSPKGAGERNAVARSTHRFDHPSLMPGIAPFYLAPDHLGSPYQIANAVRNTVWLWDHDRFGNGAPTGSLTYNLRSPSQYYNQETGLHYNGFRDYDPTTGRYAQSDPIGLTGGINTYAYVAGNPLTITDLTGKDGPS
jgi:RHS repeat-associated protein